MKEEKLRSNEKEEPIQNKKSTKNRSNLISKHQPLISDHKGITLIALVITIIVMLILVGVTVTIALNGGLFNQAKEATKDTQNAIDKENELSSGRVKISDKWYDSMDDYMKGKISSDQAEVGGDWTQDLEAGTVTNGEVTLKIGDYVNYTQDEGTYSSEKLGYNYTGYDNTTNLTTETDIKWRVLGADEKGRLTLISDKPATQVLSFSYAIGYTNCVRILNDICAELYSNKELGLTARSIKLEDVESGFSEEGLAKRYEYSLYDQTKTYTGELLYPLLYAEENGSGIEVTEEQVPEGIKTDGVNASDPYYAEPQYSENPKDDTGLGLWKKTSSSITVTCSSYRFAKDEFTTCFTNPLFADLIICSDASYWIATRIILNSKDKGYFSCMAISDGGMSRFELLCHWVRSHFESKTTWFPSGN